MRTRFYFGLLLALATGCDDVSIGQPSDSSAPPELVHVLVQDARYLLAFPNRASSLDLLDNNPFANRACTIECKGNCPGSAISPAPAQLDTCVAEFLVDQVAPAVSCQSSGICSDPLKVPSSGVPVPLGLATVGIAPDMRDPGGGIQVRLVFDKVIDSSIETVTQDPTKAPGKTDSYALAAGIIELDDEAGKPVPSGYYLDNGGSPQFSSDLELVPLGPALVIKPKVSLDAHTTYTVKIANGGAIKDRQGHTAVGLGGAALPAAIKFTTEDLTPAVAGTFGSGIDFPDFTRPATTIKPNEVIQIGFYENAAGDSATVDFTAAPVGTKPIAFSDRGSDATMCSKADPGNILVDVANSDSGVVASATPVDWPPGDYTFTITVKDINGKSTFTSPPMSFTVTGTDENNPTVDPNIAAAHLTPFQCSL